MLNKRITIAIRVFIPEIYFYLFYLSYRSMLSYTSLLRISSGGLFRTLLLLDSPIRMVNPHTPANNSTTTPACGEKELSKLYLANARLPDTDRRRPRAAARAPRKKYPSAVLIRICR